LPNLAFDVRDYSTSVALSEVLAHDLLVLVPRRTTNLPALVEHSYSSVRLLDQRLFFGTAVSPSGYVTMLDVPAGTYQAHVRATHYLPVDVTVNTPLLAPLRIPLHRDASYAFARSDTLVRGAVVRASGAPLTGFDVRLDDPDVVVPHHRVPLNRSGEFVIFIPEKVVASAVTLEVFHAGGSLLVPTPVIPLNRSTVIPLITVP
jgi:hypothetical protein